MLQGHVPLFPKIAGSWCRRHRHPVVKLYPDFVRWYRKTTRPDHYREAPGRRCEPTVRKYHCRSRRTGAALGNVNVTWQKAFHEENKHSREEGRGVLALSAFVLSSLPTPAARKQMVKQMWESGAEMMVILNNYLSDGS